MHQIQYGRSCEEAHNAFSDPQFIPTSRNFGPWHFATRTLDHSTIPLLYVLIHRGLATMWLLTKAPIRSLHATRTISRVKIPSFVIWRISCVCATACVDVGLTVSERYSGDINHAHLRRSSLPAVTRTTTVGYVAHLTGALAGLAAGFLILRRPTSTPTTADRDRRFTWRRRRRLDVVWSAVASVFIP